MITRGVWRHMTVVFAEHITTSKQRVDERFVIWLVLEIALNRRKTIIPESRGPRLHELVGHEYIEKQIEARFDPQ